MATAIPRLTMLCVVIQPQANQQICTLTGLGPGQRHPYVKGHILVGIRLPEVVYCCADHGTALRRHRGDSGLVNRSTHWTFGDRPQLSGNAATLTGRAPLSIPVRKKHRCVWLMYGVADACWTQ